MTWPCVLPHRYQPERPRQVVDGLLVCHGCLDRLEQCLAELPSQHRGLSLCLARAATAGSKVSGSPERQLSIDPAVAELRVDIPWKLVSWVRMIAEQRELNEPMSNEVEALASWLLVHLRWACAQRWVDEYAAELLGYQSVAFGRWVPGLRARANALLWPSGRRHVVVGDCIERAEGPVTLDGRWPLCPGRLVATIVPADGLLPSSVDCDVAFEHTWPSGQWSTLGRKMHGPAGYDERAAAAFVAVLGHAS